MDPLQRAVVAPQAKVAIHRAARRQVFRNVAPLASGAQDVHHAVHHLAHVDAPLAAATPGGRDQAARYAAIPRPSGRSDSATCRGCREDGFRCPHRAPHKSTPQGIIREPCSSSGFLNRQQPTQTTRKVLGRTRLSRDPGLWAKLTTNNAATSGRATAGKRDNAHATPRSRNCQRAVFSASQPSNIYQDSMIRTHGPNLADRST